MSKLKTAVAYVRYSNARLQNERSLADQEMFCHEIAKRHNCKIVKVYQDKGKSAETLYGRDGLLSMMKDAEAGKFQAVIVETLSRIARDTADNASIYRQLKFLEIDIFAASGKIDDTAVGVAGIVNPQHNENIRLQVKRTLRGIVAEGRYVGKPPYGYRRVKGKKFTIEINPETKAIVIRIFEEYVAGVPLREIAAGLNRDGVPSPTGKGPWLHTTLSGGGQGGIVSNPIYIGTYRYGRFKNVKNPNGGKVTRRKAGANDLPQLNEPRPALAFVPLDLFERAQVRRRSNKEERCIGQRAYFKTKREYLLAGKLTCSACGGHMSISRSAKRNDKQSGGSGPRVSCYNARVSGTCDHKKSYSMDILEREVLERGRELDAEELAALTAGAVEGYAKRAKEAGGERKKVQDEINKLEVSKRKLVDAIASADGDEDIVPALVAKMKEIGIKRAGLGERLKQLDADASKVAIHPKAAEASCRSMREVCDGLLRGDKLSPERQVRYRVAFDTFFERVTIYPTAARAPYELQAFARQEALISGIDIYPKVEAPAKTLAKHGVSVGTTLDGSGARAGQKYTSHTLVSLGRWRQAA